MINTIISKFQCFRNRLFQLFHYRAGATMDLIDTVAATAVDSVVKLNLSSLFRRKYSSLTDVLSSLFRTNLKAALTTEERQKQVIKVTQLLAEECAPNSRLSDVSRMIVYVYSFLPNQTDSGPAPSLDACPRLTTDFKFKLTDRKSSVLRNTYFKLGMAKYWAQNNIYSAYYSEVPSLAYTLFHAGAGTNFVNRKTGKTICSAYINCNNLLNTAYADHLNLAQVFLATNGTPVTVTQQSQGIYNMGRNVGIKLLFPIGGHKVSETEMQGMD